MKLNTRILLIGIVCIILSNTLKLHSENRIENSEQRSEKKDDFQNSTDMLNSSGSAINKNQSSDLNNTDTVSSKYDNSSNFNYSSTLNSTDNGNSNTNELKNLTKLNEEKNTTSDSNQNKTLSDIQTLNIANNLNDTSNRTEMQVVYIDMRNNSVSPNPEVPEGPVVANIITTLKDPVITPEHKEPDMIVESTDRAIDMRKSLISKEAKKNSINIKEENKADRTSKKQDGLVSPKIETTPKSQIPQYRYEPVRYVKEISSAGKAALELQESADTDYVRLLNAGFESPKYISKILSDSPTPVATPANVNYLWKPTDPRDQGLWQNVEFNRYDNRLLDVSHFVTPAHFEMNEFGNTVVHAPSDNALHISTPARVISSPNIFIDIEENDYLKEEGELEVEEVERKLENDNNIKYAFLS